MKSRTLLVSASVAALTLGGAAIAQQGGGGRFRDQGISGGGVVEGGRPGPMISKAAASVTFRGACSYTEATVTCWNPQGVADPELTSLVERALRSNSSSRVQLQFGAKNRIIAVSRDSDVYLQYRSAGGEYLNAIQTQDDLAPKTDLLFVATARERKTGEIVATLNSRGAGPTVRFAPRVGASVQNGGFGFMVRSVDAKPRLEENRGFNPYDGGNRSAPQPKLRKTWRIVLDVSRPGDARATFSASPLGSDGGPIAEVDAEGRPKKPSVRPKAPPFGDPRAPLESVFSTLTSSETPDTITFVSAIDPTAIASIDLGVGLIEVVRLGDIPLDSTP